MSARRKAEDQFKRIMQQEKLEVSLTPELVERMDYVVELLDLGSRENLVLCAIRRYVDRYPPLIQIVKESLLNFT